MMLYRIPQGRWFSYPVISEHILFLPLMAQKKLQRFEAINSFPNVLQYPEGMAGNWHDFFKNKHPITLELACGKGEYTIGLASLYPGRNFIGVDLKGNRIYVGAKKCLESGLKNAGFLRTDIEKLDSYFRQGEVDEIWLTFPDPQLRISRAKKRLTHPRFLRLYQQVLKKNGLIHLKTDSPVLYHFTRLVIELYGLRLHEDLPDIYHGSPLKKELSIQTYYESLDIAQSKKVYYLSFTLPEAGLPSIDKILQQRTKENEQGIESRG